MRVHPDSYRDTPRVQSLDENQGFFYLKTYALASTLHRKRVLNVNDVQDFLVFRTMATVYILYSQKIDNYYVGSCLDLKLRLEEHRNGKKDHAFTKRSDDWVVYFELLNLEYQVSRKIESHIKKMKSRKYFENLVTYP